MQRLNLDLVGVVALAALVQILTLLGLEVIWLRTLFALPLALFGVGYALGIALFPLRPLGGVERFLLSLGLSLSTLILVGLLLHLLPFGLQPESWAWALFLVTSAAGITALFRRWFESRPADSYQPVHRIKSDKRYQKNAIRGMITLLPLALVFSLAALMALFSLTLVRMPAPQGANQGYSLLWLAPTGPEDRWQVKLGVRSMEFSEQSYRLELYAGEQFVQQWDSIHLAPQEEWAVSLDLEGYADGEEPLEAHLYRLDRPGSLYRLARLWPPDAPNLPPMQGSGTVLP